MATIKKHYPIEGRKDFFKYTIVDDNGTLHKDYKGQEMYFDSHNRATEVCDAINKVDKILRDDKAETNRKLNLLKKSLVVLLCVGGMGMAYVFNYPSLGAVITVALMFTIVVKLD